MDNSAWHMVSAQEIISIVVIIVVAVVFYSLREIALKGTGLQCPLLSWDSETWKFVTGEMVNEPGAGEPEIQEVWNSTFQIHKRFPEEKEEFPVGPQRMEIRCTVRSCRETDCSSIWWEPPHSQSSLKILSLYIYVYIGRVIPVVGVGAGCSLVDYRVIA